ncbi:MAG: D-alanyl-D-alanine carboxypeptidase, partial [Actinomycetota bacterium]|nr:D-alanyl-D-alanine carboxypeptidase [Actinomycetota bacterium]
MKRGRRRPSMALAGVLAVVLVAAGITAVVFRGSDRHPAGPGRRGAAAVPVASAVAPVLLPDNGRGPLPSAAGLLRGLGAALGDRRLGSRVAFAVVDADTGRYLTGRDTTRPATPASVTKLVTAAAVLQSVGPLARIPTRVVAGAHTGEVVLVGGGDPTLSVGTRQAYPGAGRLDVLAAAVRRAAGGPVRRLVVDGSTFSGPTTGPGWDSDLVSSGNVAPITAVMLDGGRVDPLRRARSPAPDLAAGRALAQLLGVPRAAVSRGRAPAGARELARVRSAPVATLVEQALTASDNVLAEALARQVAISRSSPASFAGAVSALGAT